MIFKFRMIILPITVLSFGLSKILQGHGEIAYRCYKRLFRSLLPYNMFNVTIGPTGVKPSDRTWFVGQTHAGVRPLLRFIHHFNAKATVTFPDPSAAARPVTSSIRPSLV